jgi:hypothetical protein
LLTGTITAIDSSTRGAVDVGAVSVKCYYKGDKDPKLVGNMSSKRICGARILNWEVSAFWARSTSRCTPHMTRHARNNVGRELLQPASRVHPPGRFHSIHRLHDLARRTVFLQWKKLHAAKLFDVCCVLWLNWPSNRTLERVSYLEILTNLTELAGYYTTPPKCF